MNRWLHVVCLCTSMYMHISYTYIHTCAHALYTYVQHTRSQESAPTQMSSEEEAVEYGVHPCTWWVAECIQATPLMRLEARTRGMPKAPRRTLLFSAAESLLADGCAALAGQALQTLVKEEGRLDAKARALAIRACLAQIADTVKNEASQHGSTAYHQGPLTRVRLQLQVRSLCVFLSLSESTRGGTSANTCTHSHACTRHMHTHTCTHTYIYKTPTVRTGWTSWGSKTRRSPASWAACAACAHSGASSTQ